ncbi:hypothetical protein CKM354_000478400 [Cercospora kikuchii]|uniref:Pre-mRNA polyadenylation factor Fip1 domain-containing protein n=1 Tax=Cercospora kikuchii TaxID=84275 RepID=A0A9P3CGG8_9PEZI|nr:cleavage polyadenylation factor subunit FIP1 [Cercospora kikuchii]GIZ41481.1 hypothetical protein CKM354_000478400 [Cercospora kikuchii]
MEDEEDDFYGGGGDSIKQEEQTATNAEEHEKDAMDVSEDEDDDSSDDDVQFTLERPEGAKAEPPPGSKAAKAQKKEPPSKAVKIESDKRGGTPVKREDAPRAGSAAPPTAIKGVLTHNSKEGKDFPEVRTSQLDINQVPVWTNGKPIVAVDIDADLAEHSKPWRLPGTDQTDYFNYGFDEYTWTQYSLRQQEMSGTIGQLKQEDASLKAMLGVGGQQQSGPPPDMMGMDPHMIAQQSGIPLEFVQQFMSQGGMPPGMGPGMGMPPGGPQGFGQGPGVGNDSGTSPHPQPGQGFQPPQGPAAGNMSMEGLSPQQMAIFQQEQQQQMGGGGGGGGGGHRGGRRGRGRW